MWLPHTVPVVHFFCTFASASGECKQQQQKHWWILGADNIVHILTLKTQHLGNIVKTSTNINFDYVWAPSTASLIWVLCSVGMEHCPLFKCKSLIQDVVTKPGLCKDMVVVAFGPNGLSRWSEDVGSDCLKVCCTLSSPCAWCCHCHPDQQGSCSTGATWPLFRIIDFSHISPV